MPDHIDRFSVIFRSGLPTREYAFFTKMCGRLTSPGGEDLLYLRCAKVDTSHHVYLQADVISHDGQSVYPIQVPHQFVMLITGHDLPKAIGFTADRDGL
jgi:hypothetical protein